MNLAFWRKAPNLNLTFPQKKYLTLTAHPWSRPSTTVTRLPFLKSHQSFQLEWTRVRLIWQTKPMGIPHPTAPRPHCLRGQQSKLQRVAPYDLQKWQGGDGRDRFRVKRFSSWHLNTKVLSATTKKYLTQLEENLSRHWLIEKLGGLHLRCKKKKHFQRELNKLDLQSWDLMLNTERKCRRIKLVRIPFSSESALWIWCTQVYQSLLQYHKGLIRNQGNLKWTAWWCGINNCLSIPQDGIKLRLKVCTQKCELFRKHGKEYWRKHLNDCLERAREKEDSD